LRPIRAPTVMGLAGPRPGKKGPPGSPARNDRTGASRRVEDGVGPAAPACRTFRRPAGRGPRRAGAPGAPGRVCGRDAARGLVAQRSPDPVRPPRAHGSGHHQPSNPEPGASPTFSPPLPDPTKPQRSWGSLQGPRGRQNGLTNQRKPRGGWRRREWAGVGEAVASWRGLECGSLGAGRAVGGWGGVGAPRGRTSAR